MTSRRNAFIAGSVLLFHAAGLWALQSGLARRVLEVVVPVAMLSEMLAPPAPLAAPPAPVPPKPEPVRDAAPRQVKTAPSPQPLALPDTLPSAHAPTGVIEPQPAPAPIAAPVAAAPAAAPPRIELPSSAAEYLQNPAPHYPPLSKRMGEQGKVLVRVLIGADGRPQKSELKRSSGYDRLDRAALDYVMRCRYVPGRSGGVPQAMWYEAPVNFVLE